MTNDAVSSAPFGRPPAVVTSPVIQKGTEITPVPSACQKSFFDKLVDGGASSPATATPCRTRIRFPAEILLIGSSRGLRPSRAHPEAEGTDSPPHHPFSDSAEILRISGRGICKEAIFSPGGQAPAPKKSAPGATNQNLRFRLVGREATCLPFGQATFPPRRSPASIGSREGSHPLELSRGMECMLKSDKTSRPPRVRTRRTGSWG